jgi:glucosamine-6-phosphate deaminase
MAHLFYQYDKQKLLLEPKVNLEVYKDNEEVFKIIAREMADEIKRKNELGDKTVFICPVGPIGQYPYFVEIVNAEQISLKNTWFLNMDEYLTDDKKWIAKENKLSFRGFMEKVVYSKIDEHLLMPENQRVFPDPENPNFIDNLIKELGGVDICFGGIGINGHLAFNEADSTKTVEEFRNLPTRILEISRETKTTNAIGDLNGAIEAMPTYCITIGMHAIYHARKIRLACFRDWHRAVVRRTAHGEVSPDFPASLIQDHPDVVLRMTEFVANLPQ